MEPKFEHSALERDLQRLSQEVIERKGKPEAKEMPDREIVKSILQAKIKAPAPTESQANLSEEVLPKYLEHESPEIKLKVEELIEVAFHQGIDQAIAEAKKYGPFILDALHDSLTGKIYDELKNRKLL